MAVPETRYARNGDVHLAYQVVGDGPVTLVGSCSTPSGLELADRGEHALKGVPGEWRVFAVAG
jgi:hypothetical protein